TCVRCTRLLPATKMPKGGVGFGGAGNFESGAATDTFAYLEDELIEAKIVDEMRDHPLLLLPRTKRRELIEQRLEGPIRDGYRPADYLLRGDLSHRNRQIFEAPLASCHGDRANGP